MSGFDFAKMDHRYLGRYKDVMLEQFPALTRLLDQLHDLPAEQQRTLADIIAKFGMALAHPGKLPALEETMLRLLQLPPNEREAWGQMLMALMSGVIATSEQ